MVAAWTLVNRRKANPKLATEEVAKAEKLHDFALARWVEYLFPEGPTTTAPTSPAGGR